MLLSYINICVMRQYQISFNFLAGFHYLEHTLLQVSSIINIDLAPFQWTLNLSKRLVSHIVQD